MSRLEIEITIEVDEEERWKLHEALTELGYSMAEGGETRGKGIYTTHDGVEVEYEIVDDLTRQYRDSLNRHS